MGVVPVQGGPALGADVAAWYGIPDLVDWRDHLPWYDGGGPVGRDNLSAKHRIVWHFRGPAADLARSDLEIVQGDALYHIQKNWGTGYPPTRGNGLMYHFVIPRSGVPRLTRTAEHWSWHAVAEWANRRAIAVYIPIGIGQGMTDEQEAGLFRFTARWLQLRGGSVHDVYGHGDVVASECPGGVLRDALARFQKRGNLGMSDVRWFPETRQAVGGAFLQHWQTTGGLQIHGLPLSAEFDIADDSEPEGRRTVQVFERSVLEWHPENEEPFKVLGVRLGADALPGLLKRKL